MGTGADPVASAPRHCGVLCRVERRAFRCLARRMRSRCGCEDNVLENGTSDEVSATQSVVVSLVVTPSRCWTGRGGASVDPFGALRAGGSAIASWRDVDATTSAAGLGPDTVLLVWTASEEVPTGRERFEGAHPILPGQVCGLLPPCCTCFTAGGPQHPCRAVLATPTCDVPWSPRLARTRRPVAARVMSLSRLDDQDEGHGDRQASPAPPFTLVDTVCDGGRGRGRCVAAAA